MALVKLSVRAMALARVFGEACDSWTVFLQEQVVLVKISMTMGDNWSNFLWEQVILVKIFSLGAGDY